MKKLLIISMALIFAVTGASTALAKTKWDMHLNYPAGNFHSQGAQMFADRVKEATDGELEIVLHPGAALGFKGPSCCVPSLKDSWPSLRCPPAWSKATPPSWP